MYVKTSLAIRAKCKCGNVVAASIIYGGDTIDSDFTTTIAEVYNSGGSVDVIDTEEESISFGECNCN